MEWYRTGTYTMDSDPPGYRITKCVDDEGLSWYDLFHRGQPIKQWHDYQTLMEQAERHSGAIPP